MIFNGLSSRTKDFLCFVLFPFLAWMFFFRGFVSGHFFADVGDASYYQQTLFFINNLIHGVYPLWDPTYYDGSPFSFFLRRIGETNPCYFFIFILKLFGVPDFQAYRCFITLYFFLAVFGFWLLARLFLKDRMACGSAALILLFSGWGSRAFCDYIILLFVPLVWFFYFLFSFFREFKKYQMLGIALTAAVGLTTYIPSFFLITVIFFVGSMTVLFFVPVTGALAALWRFVLKQRLFTFLALAFFLLMLLPTFLFLQETRQGAFVLPGRADVTAASATTARSSAPQTTLTVSATQARVGDLMSQGHFDRVFTGQQEMTPFDFFITYFVFFALALAVVNPLTRMAVLLLFNGGLMFLISVGDASSFYKFFHGTFFLFKYVRMVSFFFWIAALPMLIFFVAMQIDLYIEKGRSRPFVPIAVFVVLVHLAVAFLLYRYTGAGILLWVAALASCSFFLIVVRPQPLRWTFLLLFLAIAPQAVEAAWHMPKNTTIVDQSQMVNRFKTFKEGFLFQRPFSEVDAASLRKPMGSIYCGTRWYHDLSTRVPAAFFLPFVSNKLYFFNNVEFDAAAEAGVLIPRIIDNWEHERDVVLVSGPRPVDKGAVQRSSRNAPVIRVTPDSRYVKVVAYDANTLKLRTDLDERKFLLWVDGYYPGWTAFTNGKAVPLFRADHAFKGVWLPEGRSLVLFRFLTPWHYAGAWFILAVSWAVLLILVWTACKDGSLGRKGVVFG